MNSQLLCGQAPEVCLKRASKKPAFAPLSLTDQLADLKQKELCLPLVYTNSKNSSR